MEKKHTFAQNLSALLVKKKFFSEKEAKALRKAFKDSEKEQFDDFLLEEGLIEKDDLLRVLGVYYQVPAFDVVGHFFDTFQLQRFPKDFLLRNGIIPLDVDENMLFVVASEPDNPELESLIRGFVSYDINFFVGIRRDICDAVKEFYDKSVTQEPEDVDLRAEHRLEQAEDRLEDESEEVSEEERDEAW